VIEGVKLFPFAYRAAGPVEAFVGWWLIRNNGRELAGNRDSGNPFAEILRRGATADGVRKTRRFDKLSHPTAPIWRESGAARPGFTAACRPDLSRK
jgi:hypothetical protein